MNKEVVSEEVLISSYRMGQDLRWWTKFYVGATTLDTLFPGRVHLQLVYIPPF